MLNSKGFEIVAKAPVLKKATLYRKGKALLKQAIQDNPSICGESLGNGRNGYRLATKEINPSLSKLGNSVFSTHSIGSKESKLGLLDYVKPKFGSVKKSSPKPTVYDKAMTRSHY